MIGKAIIQKTNVIIRKTIFEKERVKQFQIS